MNQLKAEAAAYYAQLLAKLAALANPPKNPAAEAAAKAAMPYFKAQRSRPVEWRAFSE